jgi:hypothetical protein
MQLPKTEGDLFEMKRTLFVASSTLMLCSLLLLITVGTTQGTEPGYTRTEYPTIVEPTIDGTWTSPDEWTDGEQTNISENVTFRSTYTQVQIIFTTVHFVIEILNDNTNDTGDYWQICIDGLLDGGTSPQGDDFRIDVVGHTNLTVYRGSLGGWTEITPEAGELIFAESISASPTSSTPHWIAEFSIDTYNGVIVWIGGIEGVGLRVAVYDESNSAAGVQAWPPTARDVPEGWGLESVSEEEIPEGLSFGAVVVLSSVAVIVATIGFRKRSKTRNAN